MLAKTSIAARAMRDWPATAGSISFLAIDAGTFQAGLTMMCSISSEKIGVWFWTLPTTMRVVWTISPLRTTSSWKSGMLTLT